MGRHDDWLDRHAAEWVRAGLVSDDQADAIRRFEHHDDSTESVERLTIGAEVTSYLGSVLALMGGAFVVGRRWEVLAFGGRLSLALAVALVGLAAGTWLVTLGEAGTIRLGAFLWAIGTGGVAMSVAVTADELVDDPGWILLAVGAAVALLGLGLWRNRERPLQLLTTAVGFVLVMAGIGELVEIPVLVGSTVLIVTGGVVATAAAAGWLLPRELTTIVGGSGAYIGAFSLGELNDHLGPFAAMAVAVVLMVYALASRRVPILVIGVLGTLVATQAALATTFSGTLASTIVAVIGLLVVVAAVVRSLHSNQPGLPGAARRHEVPDSS